VFVFSGFTGTVNSQSFDKARLDSLLNYFYDNNKFQGTVTISDNGENIYNKSYGFLDITNKIPANTGTKYRIGSISKTFTAVMIFNLIIDTSFYLYPKTKAEMIEKIKSFKTVFEPVSISDTEFTYDQAGLVMIFSEDGEQLTLKQGGETYLMKKEK
jgi:hypothetical protein